MEFIVYIFLMVVMLSILFYGQIFLYLNKYKNLKALQMASESSQAAKEFYMAYIDVYQTGDHPIIKTVLKDIEFNPPIEPNEGETMDFNLNPLAIKNLKVEAESLQFSAKFYGQIIDLSIPLDSILHISGKSRKGISKE